jgi:CspA family cold shock protein
MSFFFKIKYENLLKRQDGGGEDVFCHHTAIQADGFRTLAEGQKVQFDINKGPKGLQAANVRPI